MPLTDMLVRNAKPKDKAYFLYDTEKIYIEIAPSGSKLWRIKYRFNGKERRTALFRKPESNYYPAKTIKDARKRLEEIELILAQGLDPMLENSIPGMDTFKALAEDWKARKGADWSPEHLRVITARIEKHLYPSLANMPPKSLSPRHFLSIIRTIEDAGSLETAHRILGIASQIMRYGVTIEAVESDPCRDLKGALKPHTSKNLPAITDPKEVGGLMRAIDTYKGSIVVRHALLFSALTFCRPGEIRQAEWQEIDFKEKVWIIPESKMKMRKAHIVPLSKQAIAVLKSIKMFTGNGKFVFPSPRTELRPLSDAGVQAALACMGYKTIMTAHGFRSMASTLLNELGYKHDVIEAQLAHAGYDKIRAVYNRAEYMEERRNLMQAWADYLDRLKTSLHEPL